MDHIMRTYACALAAASALTFGLTAATEPSIAVSGEVKSAADGRMEGVLVSLKRLGSTITTTVVSDEHGRYGFAASRLPPGRYSVRIRAVGYDLEAPQTIEVRANNPTTADLTLRKTNDAAAQLSNAEWLASFPGTDQEKASIRNCTHCHTLERVA